MSSFTAPLDVRIHDVDDFELLRDLSYYVGATPETYTIYVPKGYRTDLASVPRFLWSLYPPHGRWAKAAVIHDRLYTHQYEHPLITRKMADYIFLEGMRILNVPEQDAKTIYLAVRAFGWIYWDADPEDDRSKLKEDINDNYVERVIQKPKRYHSFNNSVKKWPIV